MSDIVVANDSASTTSSGASNQDLNMESQPHPIAMDPSRLHFQQRYREIRFLGQGDNGKAYAAVAIADANELLVQHKHEKTPAFYKALRGRVVAVKVARPDYEENDLSNEIRILTQALTIKHPLYTACVDASLDGEVQWLALPYISGGSLEDFVITFPSALSLGFRWHIGHCLAEALLFVLYGICQSRPLPSHDWPLISHGDVYACNILLDFKNGFGGYPNAVVADFGRAEVHAEADELGHIEAQMFDIDCVAVVLEDMEEHEFMAQMPNEWDSSIQGEAILQTALTRLRTPLTGRETGMTVLRAFVDIARRQRASCYRPLTPSVWENLRSDMITDDELEAAVSG